METAKVGILELQSVLLCIQERSGIFCYQEDEIPVGM